MSDMLQQGSMTNFVQLGHQSYVSPASVNTPGTWTQIFASTAQETSRVVIDMYMNTGIQRWSIDIGIGTSGQQVVVIPRIFGFNYTVDDFNVFHTVWPVRIPAGSTVWARCTNHVDSVTRSARVSTQLWSGDLNCTPAFSQVDLLASSVTMDVTTSTWHTNIVQVSASLSYNYRAIAVSMEPASAGAMDTSTGTWWCSVMLGAASSEVATVPGLRFQMDTATDTGPDMYYHFIPVSLPQGERLSLGLASTATADDVAFNVWGFR